MTVFCWSSIDFNKLHWVEYCNNIEAWPTNQFCTCIGFILAHSLLYTSVLCQLSCTWYTDQAFVLINIIYLHASTGAGVQSQRKAVQFPCAVHQGSYQCSCVLWGQHHQSVSWECVALQVQENTSPSGLQSSREILDILRQCWRKSVSRIW